MRVLRGRAGDIDADREATRELFDWTGRTGTPAVRIWRPHRQVAFGRRDAREDGYDRARAVAREEGFPPVARDVGGRAVAYTGDTVAAARIDPVADYREGLDDRYERFLGALERALAAVGVDAERDEPPNAFCPGAHSLQAAGKLAGVAQRVRGDAALVAGVLLVDDHDDIAAVLDDVYAALGLPLDPDAVGSVARAGGDADPECVRSAVERELVGDADPDVHRLG